MPNLLTFANLGGAGADSGGCWEFVGARLIGTSGAWLAPQILTVGGVPGSYANGDSVGATDDPLVVFEPDWCGYELAFIYTNDCGGPVACVVETQFVFDVLDSCCDCAVDAVISVLGCVLTVDSDGCVCTGGCSYEWDRSCDGQQTWTHLPVFDGDSSIIADDNCCYRVRVTDCDDGCNNTSNVLCVTCYDPCPGSITATVDGCLWKDFVYPCTPAFWAFSYSFDAGANYDQYVSGTNNPLDPFQVPFTALWKLFIVCDNGCQETITQNFASCDPPCDCTGQLTFNQASCSLIVAGFNGVDCGVNQDIGYWLYSGTNTPPWTVVGTEVIAGPGSFSYTPTENGWYRFFIESSTGLCKCTGALIGECVLGPIHVTCVPVCDCAFTLSESNCMIIYNDIFGACGVQDGYAHQWAYNEDGIGPWTLFSAPLDNLVPEDYFGNGFYRLTLSKADCSDVVLIIEITCVPVCSPTVTITQLPDCRLQAIWSGCDGVPVTSQWNPAIATTTPGSCGGAFGWGANIADDLYVANPDGTGQAIITPTAGETCYRFWISCCSDTGIVEDQFWWTPCCEDNPSIDITSTTCNYNLSFYDPNSIGNTDTGFCKVSGNNNSTLHNFSLGVRVTGCGGVEIYNEILTEQGTIARLGAITDMSVVEVGGYCKNMTFWDTLSDSEQTFDFNPSTSPYLSGVDVSKLYINNPGVTPQQWVTNINLQMQKCLLDEYGATSLNHNIFFEYDGSVYASQYDIVKHNPTGLWIGAGKSIGAGGSGGWTLTEPIAGNTINSMFQNPEAIFGNNVVLSGTIPIPCGFLAFSKELTLVSPNFSPSFAGGIQVKRYPTYVSPGLAYPDTLDYYPLGLPYVNTSGFTQIWSDSCTTWLATVGDECAGATYLWNTAEITESISPTVPGTYTVQVTCPDGCIYNLETTFP